MFETEFILSLYLLILRGDDIDGDDDGDGDDIAPDPDTSCIY